MSKRTLGLLVACALSWGGMAQAETTLRVVNHSDLKIIDPIWTTAYIVRKKIAETDPAKQIEDATGSGPFIFVKNEWKPGEKTVYVKNLKYKPRAEPPSGLAGGKIAKVDRVEWVAMSDQQTVMNALLK